MNSGAEIDIQNYSSYQETALHIAARKGHATVAALLIERGVNIYMRSYIEQADFCWYGTAIKAAAFYNHKEIVAMLYD